MRIIVASVLASMIVAFVFSKWIRNRKQEKECENDFELNQNHFQDNEQKEVQPVEKKKKIKNNKIEAEEIIPFAYNVRTAAETQYVLEQNNSAKVQFVLAKTRDFDVQSYLITYPYLKASALVTICEKPALFDFDDITVQEWFTDAIERVKLKKEHEIRIAKTKNYVIKRALLQRSKLSYEGFLEICKHPKQLKMDDDELQQVLEEITRRLLPSLNSMEKFELAKTKREGIINALIE